MTDRRLADAPDDRPDTDHRPHRGDPPTGPRRRATRPIAACAAALALGTAALTAPPASASDLPRGHDVSSHQGHVDWADARTKGARFVYVKATESRSYRNPRFRGQYGGARKAGLLRGAYHFALPDKSSGTAQAAYFVRHGGDWRPDGWTLPPALDIERNPYGGKCYGLGKAAMVRWIREFSDEVRRRTGRHPVIYTSTDWWNDCTGHSKAFGSDHALWLARYSSAGVGRLPAGWSYWTFWQYDSSGVLPGDQNVFNGSRAALRRLARG